MAKRKRKNRLGGFGLTKAEHQYRAGSEGRAARTKLRQMRQYLAVGDCRRAAHALLYATAAAAELRVHSNSRSLRIGKRKKSGRGGHSHVSMDALQSSTNRFMRACVKGGAY